MRNSLIYELISDLLGPRDIELDIEQRCEEVLTLNPLDEYLVGVLHPFKEETSDIEEIEEEVSEGLVTFDDPDNFQYVVEEHENFGKPPSELEPNKPPSSFGLSFNVNKDNPQFSICITWARYRNRNDNYYRTPYGKFLDLEIVNDELQHEILENEDDNGTVDLFYKKSFDFTTKSFVISLFFVNNLIFLSKKKSIKVNNCIFQPQLRIKSINETKIVQMNENEEDILSIIYSDFPVLGRGFATSVVWKKLDYLNPKNKSYLNSEIFWPDGYYLDSKSQSTNFIEYLSCDLRTEFVPITPIVRPEFIPYSLSKMDLSTEKLSELWEPHEFDILFKITDEYKNFISKNENIFNNTHSIYTEKYKDILNNQKIALKRMKDGISLLKERKDIRIAFNFANRAIFCSNKWKKGEDFAWYPFQLSFILLNIKSICEKDDKYRDYVDLLWIPTGGGKTEAYLAIIAFNIAFRRISENYDENLIPKKEFTNKSAGTTVITRYTLRLLTIQQFRRTLSLIVASDYLRILDFNGSIGWRPKKCNLKLNFLFGATKISIGLWVGSKVTPSYLNSKEGSALQFLVKPNSKTVGEPAQILQCPVCRSSWLSIPKRGLTKNSDHSIYWLLIYTSTKENIQEIKKKLDFSKFKPIKIESIFNIIDNHYLTLQIIFKSEYSIMNKDILDVFKYIESYFKKNNVTLENQSINISRPGYFGIENKFTRNKKRKYYDFEIYCTNPSCPLCNVKSYIDGVPMGDEKIGTYQHLYQNNHRGIPSFLGYMPISAYTVDDQIYGRCPTVIISTADKYARLAYEPRCASIFGNVDKYNEFFGYYRKDLVPKNIPESMLRDKNYLSVCDFRPPDLIIQDELHLMEGPLGSMFGLYEIAIDALIRQANGKPKYIASTATIKNADEQIRLIFAKKVLQFPPYGLSIDDSFFVYNNYTNLWNKDQPGRYYLGVFVPGLGPQLPNLRIWAALLQKVEDFRLKAEKKEELRNFWTLVGYFNALHVLGNARAIIRDDVVDRLKQLDENHYRNLKESHIKELSGQIDSTDIAEIIKELEDGGLKTRDILDNPDIILSTSMFGTGVDIGHLSMMTVQGQPKSTSQYIQATGRVGRDRGGLVILQFKASRPRDISHYEMFTSYHSRIYLEVEPISVAPFSKNALIKAAGPVCVAFLRNMRESKYNWTQGISPVNFYQNQENHDIDLFLKFIKDRLKFINKISLKTSIKLDINEIIVYFQNILNKWNEISCFLNENNKYLYFNQFIPSKKISKYQKEIEPVDVVLGDPLHEELPNIKVVFHNSPQSLREVDENIGFKSDY